MGDISKIVCVLFLYALNRFYLKNVVVIPAISYILKCHFNDFLGGIFIIAYINLILEHSKYRHYRVDTVSMAVTITLICEYSGSTLRLSLCIKELVMSMTLSHMYLAE